MDIIYAAEKPTIASLLGAHLRRAVSERDIAVAENPDETGSFLIDCDFERYVLSPGGEIRAEYL